MMIFEFRAVTINTQTALLQVRDMMQLREDDFISAAAAPRFSRAAT